ncbi:hypothetical protein M5K25_004963 [Dendrobium thyrsiflorum]|uniref:VTT domain-containing protein n=1 Tax=Dendrobium thyrsiflorum TaxID=117978 RepID=A0ABD0VHE2_DENTH
MGKGLAAWTVAAAAVAILVGVNRRYGWDGEAALQVFRGLSEKLGFWAIPLYVLAHTLTLALCLPYAVFFEAGASLLFGFLPAILCVFSAKILGASLSFWIGRAVFSSSKSAMEFVRRNKYFNLLSKGVERDGWRFVLLARFSPVPSYVINYALAATNVHFLIDFLLPTVIGCLPMILQNTSIGSLAGAAVSSTTGSKKSHLFSYLFPLIGIGSSVLISLRIKKYSSGIVAAAECEPSCSSESNGCDAKIVESISMDGQKL